MAVSTCLKCAGHFGLSNNSASVNLTGGDQRRDRQHWPAPSRASSRMWPAPTPARVSQNTNGDIYPVHRRVASTEARW